MKETHTHGSRPCRPQAALLCAIMLTAPYLAAGQAPATPAASPGAREIPRPDELEPGVSTTPSSAPAPAAPAAAAAPAPAGATATATAPAAAAATPSSSAAATGGAGAAKTAKGTQKEAGAKTAGRKGPDRIELDTTDITGNRELPKVLYIVPWKRSDLGDVVGKPVNSLLDEVLQPLDRDVFRRENRYYDSLPGGAGDVKPGTAQGSPNKP